MRETLRELLIMNSLSGLSHKRMVRNILSSVDEVEIYLIFPKYLDDPDGTCTKYLITNTFISSMI